MYVPKKFGIAVNNQNKIINLTWVFLWTILLVTFVIFLPGFSEFDTSKYLKISQDMMQQHNYLLAFWEGQPYSDKPPLLFWLIIGGWKIFGPVLWWPQFIVLALATLSLLITQQLAKMLWPDKPRIAQIVPFILIGCFAWISCAKQIRVDSILAFATLFSFYSIIKCIQGQKKYWFFYICAIGLGGFAKGPVILVFVLLPVIFIPLLIPHKDKITPGWYGLLALTTIVGLCLPLLWAIPAAVLGGKAYAQEIFYRQISHRANLHEESFFFYLVRLPIWLFPWTIYPPLWKGLKSLKITTTEVVCLIAIVCSLIIFSVFGQKLPHYIYPLFPIFALLIARLCDNYARFQDKDQWPIAISIAGFAIFCLLYPYINSILPEKVFVRSYFLQEINLKTWASVFMVMSILLFFIKFKTQTLQIIAIALSCAVITVFVNDHLLPIYQKHINNQYLFEYLATAAREHRTIVASGNFEDQELLNLIRQQHIQIIPHNELPQWINQHSDAWLLTTSTQDLHHRLQPNIWFYQTRYSIVSLWH